MSSHDQPSVQTPKEVTDLPSSESTAPADSNTDALAGLRPTSSPSDTGADPLLPDIQLSVTLSGEILSLDRREFNAYQAPEVQKAVLAEALTEFYEYFCDHLDRPRVVK